MLHDQYTLYKALYLYIVYIHIEILYNIIVYKCICVYMYVCACIHLCVNVCAYKYIYTHICSVGPLSLENPNTPSDHTSRTSSIITS